MLNFAIGLIAGLLVYPILPPEWAAKPSEWLRDGIAWAKQKRNRR